MFFIYFLDLNPLRESDLNKKTHLFFFFIWPWIWTYLLQSNHYWDMKALTVNSNCYTKKVTRPKKKKKKINDFVQGKTSFLFSLMLIAHIFPVSLSLSLLALKWTMAYWCAAVPWTHTCPQVLVWFHTPTWLVMDSAASPSCTAPTANTNCRRSRCPATPPLPETCKSFSAQCIPALWLTPCFHMRP